MCAGLRAYDVSLRQSRRSATGLGADAGDRIRAGRDCPSRSGRIRTPAHQRQRASHAEHHRPLSAPERPGSHRPGDRSLRRGDVNLEDLYENAPCGYISAGADRRIIAVNATLLRWLGYERSVLVGQPFTELFATGSRIHYETHFAPLLQLNGEISGVAVDLVTVSGARVPAFITANVKKDVDGRIE